MNAVEPDDSTETIEDLTDEELEEVSGGRPGGKKCSVGF